MNTSLVRPVCWLRRFSFRGASVLLPQMGCTSSKPKVDEGSVTVTLPPDTPSSSDRPWDQTVRRGEGIAPSPAAICFALRLTAVRRLR